MEKNNKKDIVIAVLVFIIAILTIVIALFYSGILTGKNSNNTNKQDNNITIKDNNSDTITDVRRVIITNDNQVVKLGDMEYKLKKEISVDGAFLLIDDQMIDLENSEVLYAEIAYVTNKYIIFTVAAQDWESIVYVMDKDGKAIAFEDNDYQIHNLKVNDGILCASGHVFCGVDGNCPDKDLVIKYENNSITISPKN